MASAKKKIFISAGESSGDLHASNLIKELKSINPDIEFSGIGCDKMEAAGARILHRMDSLSIVGLWEVFFKIKIIRGIFKIIEEELKINRPDLAVLVDYPGFNLELAKKFKKHNIPVIYYITPQVWAWGAWRIKTIRRYIKKAVVIFGFEEAFFKKHGVDAAFVGHPLLDEYHETFSETGSRKALGLAPDKFTIALLAGSRHLEVKRMLPVMLKAASIIKKSRPDIQFIVSESPNVGGRVYKGVSKDSDIIRSGSNIYDILNASDFVITSSGTVTLQCAIFEKPMLITYITSFLTAFFVKILVRIPHIGLVNIIAGRPVAPEVLQYDASPDALAEKALEIIDSPERMEKMRNDLRNVKKNLGAKGASKRAAEIVAGYL